MGISRNILLWAAQNQRLRESLPRYRFVKKSVTRFMPGEEIKDALDAAEQLRKHGIPTVVTHLGENVSDTSETERVTRHYLEVLEQIRARGLDTHISVKLTEMGLDFDPELCYANLKSLIEKAAKLGNFVWIDMEGSSYTTATLEMFRRARSEFPNVGVCLQSYLHRTAEDLNQLLPLSPAIRLVKGAYAEPPNLAFPKKQDTDENYFKLAGTLLQKATAAFATHDEALVHRIANEADSGAISKDKFEVQMLYGIRSKEQLRLVSKGFRVRVLISYGTYWFPWYMRRLAERPANILFVLRNLFSKASGSYKPARPAFASASSGKDI